MLRSRFTTRPMGGTGRTRGLEERKNPNYLILTRDNLAELDTSLVYIWLVKNTTDGPTFIVGTDNGRTGHPTLAIDTDEKEETINYSRHPRYPEFRGSGIIGGEMRYSNLARFSSMMCCGGKWVIDNESGRFGRQTQPGQQGFSDNVTREALNYAAQVMFNNTGHYPGVEVISQWGASHFLQQQRKSWRNWGANLLSFGYHGTKLG